MIELSLDYSTFISLVLSKGLLFQYVDYSTSYLIFAVEAGTIHWQTAISKDGGANQTDFEANYKTTANAPLLGSSLSNGVQTTVGASAVQVLAGNVNRKSAIIQNVGVATVRVGVTGVTATTGLQLLAGGLWILEMPNIPTNAIFAIREGLISSTILTMETV